MIIDKNTLMEDPLLSQELIEAFRPIVEMNNARFRQVKTMLAGFITLQERDLNYMDEYMDTLFDSIPDRIPAGNRFYLTRS